MLLLPNVIGAALLAAVVGGVTAAVVLDEPDLVRTEVARVVDGDTIEVRTGEHTETVRLLNIDAPEVADCLRQEATDHLRSLLPAGTQVVLEHDVERTDRYGRTLAGVVKIDGTLVNAEMARAGLAGVITIGQNVRFHAQVSSAAWEASAQKRALHSADISCTVPAQVQVVTQAAQASVPPPTGTPAELTAAGDVATAAAARADALLARGLVWTVLSAGDQSDFRALVTAARATLGQREKDLRAAATAATARVAEEKRKADAAAEARRQAEAAAAAEEQRRADAAAAEQRRRDQEQQWTPPAASDSGYTGKRCYNPGGKTYRPC
ncbi:thermonuclease family protein [Streptomyces sp. ID05-26A]|nr:thermonuclease family protein [Streptomyces sp. ID05-26A]